MKNKIIAVFTAFCMICGAFSFNTVNITDTADNIISASAVDSERETRYGKIYYEVYSSGAYIFSASKLDSLHQYDCYYEGDSTSDIDWSKYTDISVSDYHVAAGLDKSGKDISIRCGTYTDYGHNDKIIISFEDMDFIIEVQCRFMTTIYHNTYSTTSSTTTTMTTPTTTTTYYWTYTTATVRPTTTTTTVTTTTTTTAVPVSSFRIIPSAVSMSIGDTNKLAVMGAADLSDIMWTSENTSVATVSDNGTITAKGSGSTIIYAVYNESLASCKVTVNADKSIVYGDSNGDGYINMSDATAIIQHIGNKSKYALDSKGLANADTNGDGQVTTSDAIVIQRILAGEISASNLPYKY